MSFQKGQPNVPRAISEPSATSLRAKCFSELGNVHVYYGLKIRCSYLLLCSENLGGNFEGVLYKFWHYTQVLSEEVCESCHLHPSPRVNNYMQMLFPRVF